MEYWVIPWRTDPKGTGVRSRVASSGDRRDVEPPSRSVETPFSQHTAASRHAQRQGSGLWGRVLLGLVGSRLAFVGSGGLSVPDLPGFGVRSYFCNVRLVRLDHILKTPRIGADGETGLPHSGQSPIQRTSRACRRRQLGSIRPFPQQPLLGFRRHSFAVTTGRLHAHRTELSSSLRTRLRCTR